MAEHYTLPQLQARLGGEIHGDGDVRLSDVASLGNAGPADLSFVVSVKHLEAARASSAGALVVPHKLAAEFDRPVLAVDNPHAAFARAAALFHPEPALRPGIHPSAVIDASALPMELFRAFSVLRA